LIEFVGHGVVELLGDCVGVRETPCRAGDAANG
jgi:hypothetical protein